MKFARYALMVIGGLVLAGCASGSGEELAASGTVDLQGTQPMILHAPADGQISIYDVSVDNLVYSGIIKKGQQVVIDPVTDTVTVNGLLASSKPLYGGDTLRIAFDENK